MKKVVKFLILAAAVWAFTGCQPTGQIIIGRSSLNQVPFNYLSLNRDNYKLMETLTSSASITVTELYAGFKIVEENNEFELSVLKNGSLVKLESGVLKFGYLAADIGKSTQVETTKTIGKTKQKVDLDVPTDPETIARRLAKYRLINEAKAKGADALIEPVISSDIARVDKKTVVIKTTISAKRIVLKTDE